MYSEAKITGYKVQIFTVPTDAPEADGTCTWDQTTMVLVQLQAANQIGIGYTYADSSTGKLAETLLRQCVIETDALTHGAIWQKMLAFARNLGVTGIAAMAISAIDNALWDLRARILDIPLVNLLGRVRDGIPVYGSGGFTSYHDEQLRNQLGGWAAQGFPMVKMKIGTHPEDDPRRVRLAREIVGPNVALFVDANGAYTVPQAIVLAKIFSQQDVTWFEEPVSSDNLTGLCEIRERAPRGMAIAAGEYGYTAWYFQSMIQARAVNILQADATRCCGITGFLDAASLCWATNTPLSSHCGPSMHLHVCCAVPRAIHMEFFHDHARIERMFFDGFREPKNGIMSPDLSRPGVGLELKQQDAQKYQV